MRLQRPDCRIAIENRSWNRRSSLRWARCTGLREISCIYSFHFLLLLHLIIIIIIIMFVAAKAAAVSACSVHSLPRFCLEATAERGDREVFIGRKRRTQGGRRDCSALGFRACVHRLKSTNAVLPPPVRELRVKTSGIGRTKGKAKGKQGPLTVLSTC